jgi:hypothetical protein
MLDSFADYFHMLSDALIIMMMIIIIIIISHCMKREMSQCCGIKQSTQTEKLQQIGQI